MSHWIESANIYHIYPLGFCGCERYRKDAPEVAKPRIKKVLDWLPHIKELNMNAVYFGPVFESVEHGYDTEDYYTIDKRLGTNADFKEVCDTLHENGVRVILDGVFNHVGRGHPMFEDLIKNGQSSQYKDWFAGVNFGGRSPYPGDGFSYEGWNNYYNLVKLNLYNQNGVEHLLQAAKMWIDEFKIDGIRFDAADCLPESFIKQICRFTRELKPDFWLMGEIIHGDYGRWANKEMFDSVTNYQCHKGNYSSHNDRNYFEIASNIEQGFTLKGYLYNFLDNHDVSRLMSTLRNPDHAECCYTMMYMMPGVPSVYYGSEWGLLGAKGKGADADLAVRPSLELDDIKKGNAKLMSHITTLGKIRLETPSAQTGNYSKLELRNQTFLFMRDLNGKQIYVALNISDGDYTFGFMTKYAWLTDMLSGQRFSVSNGRASVTVAKNHSMILAELDVDTAIKTHPSVTVQKPEPPVAPTVSVPGVDGRSETAKSVSVGGVKSLGVPAGRKIVLGGHYRHFKGGDYVVLQVAREHESLESQAVYMSLNGKPDVWVRPLNMFLENVEDHGVIKPRFMLIED
jgi:glycosidase